MNLGSAYAIEALPEVLEAAMLVCFGLAWPCATLRLLRTRRAQSNGPVFTLVILCGYLVGASSKMVAAALGSELAPVFWLYAVNAVSVVVNLALQIYFSRRPAAATDASFPSMVFASDGLKLPRSDRFAP